MLLANPLARSAGNRLKVASSFWCVKRRFEDWSADTVLRSAWSPQGMVPGRGWRANQLTKKVHKMAGWFELGKSADGQFRFVLKAGNAETILTSELYTTKSSAQAGIASVQANSGDDARYERKTASNGKPFFNLKAANHQVIGTSQMYASEASRDGGIASVKANGATTTIKDNT
jgi:uncharacterized protein YegP (UPF0339 family)